MTVSEPDSGVDLFGKSVTDLQENIEFGANAITGTLNYIADYSAAGFVGDEASGNFMAVKVEGPEGATITAEVVGGSHGPVTLDEDGIVVARIGATTNKLKIVASVEDGGSKTIEYDLSDLTLATE